MGRSPEEIRTALEEISLAELQAMEEVLRPENRVTWDARFCIEHFFWIKDKNKRLIKLKFNGAQDRFFTQRTNRNVIMKPRQLGFSTLILALDFWDTIVHSYVTSSVISHDFESTQRLFRIVNRFNDHLPSFLKQKTSVKNKREFFFEDTDSNFFVNTSVKLVSGRGDTINNLHASEVAFWRNGREIMPALLEAVPMDGYVDMECSPDARISRYFQEFWAESKQGMNGFRHFFYAWFDGEEYCIPLEPGEKLPLTEEDERQMKQDKLTLEQMKFYLRKRAVLKTDIHREYPWDDIKAFLFAGESFFNMDVLLAMMRDNIFAPPVEERGLKIFKPPIDGHRYVIGGDSAKGIGGGTSRCALEVLDVDDCEQVAELIARITPTQFGRVAARVGRMYNDALIGIESNHPGPATLVTLMEEEKYHPLFWYTDYARQKKTAGNSLEPEGQPGYPTNGKTRSIYLMYLKDMLESELLTVNSIDFLVKCSEFKLDENGRPSGKGDDPIIAMGIALQLRKSASMSFSELLAQVQMGKPRIFNAGDTESTTAKIFEESRRDITKVSRTYSRVAGE